MPQISVFSWVPLGLYAVEWSTGRRALNWLFIEWKGLEKSWIFFRTSGAGTLVCCLTERCIVSVLQAAAVCNDTDDRAACYHVARQYENMGQFEQAISYFSRAQAYGNAVRLCKVCSNMHSVTADFTLRVPMWYDVDFGVRVFVRNFNSGRAHAGSRVVRIDPFHFDVVKGD